MRDALTLSEFFLLLITVILLVFLVTMKPDFGSTPSDYEEVQEQIEHECSDSICTLPIFIQKGN